MDAQTTPTSGAKSAAKAPIPQAKAAASSEASMSSQAPGAAPTTTQPDSGLGGTPAFIEHEQRRAMIAEAAYYRAERRAFEPGHELDDWYLAEGEINSMLTRGEIPAVVGVTDLI
jgi:hypothetical protein